MKLRFGSVCSGIEAASVAWNPLGWEAAWFSEIEPFPCAVLAHRFPNVPNYGDMTTLPQRIPYRGKPAEECPDAPRYKAIGNSWCVPVVRWIGQRIEKELINENANT